MIAAAIVYLVMRSARRDLRDTVKAMAAEALHANTAAFLDLARASFDGLHKDAAHDLATRQKAIDGLVQPMLDALKQVDAKLAQADRERVQAYTR
ncbi:MAG: DNA recombination protein RmuC, partial [Steroidobacteraceae bacterium]